MNIDIDVIGIIYTPGEFDSEGNVTVATEALPGYHVNTTFAVADWTAYKVTPATPRRVFGGHETHFYTFADAAEYEVLLETSDLEVLVQTVPQIEPTAPAVPNCSPRQIRQALTAAGLRDAVESAIAAGDQDTKDWWAFATNFERNHPMVVGMGLALGKTDEELDALFALGASL